uniref:Transposase n=1 Tax=Caenorhabditis tropicalis TaxID=1561998 RepID=A0A1I7UEZ2_9PELO
MVIQRSNLSERQLQPYLWLCEELQSFRASTNLIGDRFPGALELRDIERLSLRIVQMGRERRSVRGQEQIMRWRYHMCIAMRSAIHIWGL